MMVVIRKCFAATFLVAVLSVPVFVNAATITGVSAMFDQRETEQMELWLNVAPIVSANIFLPRSKSVLLTNLK